MHALYLTPPLAAQLGLGHHASRTLWIEGQRYILSAGPYPPASPHGPRLPHALARRLLLGPGQQLRPGVQLDPAPASIQPRSNQLGLAAYPTQGLWITPHSTPLASTQAGLSPRLALHAQDLLTHYPGTTPQSSPNTHALAVSLYPCLPSVSTTCPCSSPPEPQPLGHPTTSSHWIEIHLVDEEENPLAQLPYALVFADGRKELGTTNDQGRARHEDLPPGSYRLIAPYWR